MSAAIHSLSIALAVVAAAMVATALAGLAMSEPEAAQQFFIMAMVTGFVAGGVYFATRRPPEARRGAARYLFLLLVWIVPPFFAAIPLMDATDGDFVSALFEAVSGLTTTGASVIERVSGLTRTDILWRAILHWLGGLLTLILIVTILAPTGVGGVPSRESVFVRRAVSGEGAKQWGLIRDLIVGYVILTLAVLIAVAFTGIAAFDAVCLAMSAVSTGGFLPVDGGLATYNNAAMEIVLAFAMIAGATSVLWHRMLVTGRWQSLRDHRESYWIIAAAIAVGLIAGLALMEERGFTLGAALHSGLVNGASLVSTTAMEVESSGFAMMPAAFVLLVVMVGGGAFSTAGGLRFFRIGGMVVESLKETRRLIYPHGVRPKLFGAREFDSDVMKAIWSLFTASIAVLAVAAAGVALAGVDFGGAAAAAVAAFSNAGNVYAAEWSEAGDWPSYAELPGAVQLLLAGVMIVGRLEIVAVVVAARLVFWKQ